jgi:hypothetical protein
VGYGIGPGEELSAATASLDRLVAALRIGK